MKEGPRGNVCTAQGWDTGGWQGHVQGRQAGGRAGRQAARAFRSLEVAAGPQQGGDLAQGGRLLLVVLQEAMQLALHRHSKWRGKEDFMRRLALGGGRCADAPYDCLP